MSVRFALVVIAAIFSGCGGGFQDTLIRDPEVRIRGPVELAVEVPDRYDVLDSEYATA